MAIYHYSAKIIGRSAGRSSVAAAAYRSGDDITNERDGIRHDYSRKEGIVFSAIIAPDNAPEWAANRAKLWNEVERTEKRKDAQTSREFEIALPIELNRQQQMDLACDFARKYLVSKGMIADIVIHDKGDGNPHAHIMTTMREINKNGFGLKNRDWNKKAVLEELRKGWADNANHHLEKAGLEERIDHRSLKDQKIDRIPTVHLGVEAAAMEKRGIASERGDQNREVHARNRERELIREKIKDLEIQDKKMEADENGRKTGVNKIDGRTVQRRYAEEVRKNGVYDLSTQRVLHDERQISLHMQKSLFDQLEQREHGAERESLHRSDRDDRVTMTAAELLEKAKLEAAAQKQIIAKAERRIIEINKQINAHRSPFDIEAAEVYFREKYSGKVADQQKLLDEINQKIIDHSKNAPSMFAIWKHNDYNKKADELEKDRQKITNELKEIEKMKEVDKRRALSNDGRMSPEIIKDQREIRRMSENMAISTASGLKGIFASLRTERADLSKVLEAAGKKNKEISSVTKALSKSKPDRKISVPISKKAPAPAPAISGGGGGGSASPMFKASSLPIVNLDSHIVALSASSREEAENIDWSMLSEAEIETKMSAIKLEQGR